VCSCVMLSSFARHCPICRAAACECRIFWRLVLSRIPWIRLCPPWSWVV
jgi:hypothetical protein